MMGARRCALSSRRRTTVHTYRIHTLESAPEKARDALQRLQKNFGMIPNLAATMAASPTLVNGFVGALVNFLGGTFTGGQRQALLLTNAVTNRSAWAVAFHSTAALREGVAADDVRAIREGRLPGEPGAGRAVGADQGVHREARAPRRPGAAPLHRGGLHPGAGARGPRRARRLGDGEPRRQHHQASSRAGIRAAGLARCVKGRVTRSAPRRSR